MIVLGRILVRARGLFCTECGRPVQGGCRHNHERGTIEEAGKLLELLRTKFRRMERFESQTAETVTSENHNGTHRIEKLTAASWGCTCLAFLRQHGLRDTGPSVACKHIEALGLSQPTAVTKPASDWQGTPGRTPPGSVWGRRKVLPKGKGEPMRYQVELLGLDVFDPATMEPQHLPGGDVPAWFLDTDYNGLCFHVCQAFFPRTGAWESLKKASLSPTNRLASSRYLSTSGSGRRPSRP